TVRVDALGSRALSRPSVRDANFAGITQFTLPTEGNRPIFVPTSAVDVASGAVSAAAGRVSPAAGRVNVWQNDLRGEAGQLTITLAPDLARVRSRIALSGAASYTLQGSRDQFRGFDGATFGDPREREWAASMNDVRHAVVVQGGLYHRRVGAVTTFLRVQSGSPFTPLVQGDINGDGRANDRAFVPATTGGDPALAASMRDLLAVAPANVRACLVPLLGRVAPRHSCRGPWTQTLNLQWTPPIPRRMLGRQLNATVFFQNPLGGLDYLLHGEAGLRGWGAQPVPDQTLLAVRGFDANARAFRYDVNPRFGDTRAFRSVTRAPFRVAIDVSVDLSVPYDVQSIRRALEPVKQQGAWARRSADSIASFYMRQRANNLYRLITSESDSLLLSKAQQEALRIADTAYVRRVRALYRPLGVYLASQPDNGAGPEALARVKAVADSQQVMFWESVDTVGTLLSAGQRAMLPILADALRVPPSARKNSFFGFGFFVDLVDWPPPR
ncbi:hypothetical protein, partial [Gemmatimonas sp.]|uniref:hypothetical protein n=1 Tax=Gemmatimonas sp. TaxID=1962908 RepID=UPI00286BE1B7